jgi:hypothetical protein
MQRLIGAIRDRDQVVGAERLATPIAMELVAAGAKHLAAIGIRARTDFEECVAAVFVVLDRKVLEKRVAGGAGGGSDLRSHDFIIAKPPIAVKGFLANKNTRGLSYYVWRRGSLRMLWSFSASRVGRAVRKVRRPE